MVAGSVTQRSAPDLGKPAEHKQPFPEGFDRLHDRSELEVRPLRFRSPLAVQVHDAVWHIDES